MNNIQIACYSLVASAFLLAGLLIFSIGGQLENEAEASMVISRDAFTLMTAQTRSNEEALWVLDNRSARLLIYRLELRGAKKGRLELSANIDLNDRTLFGAPSSSGGSPRGGR